MIFKRVKEIIKYTFLELIGYLVFILLAMIIRNYGFYYIFANLVAYGFEIILKYIVCKFWIFYKSGVREFNSFTVYIGIELLGIVICNLKRIINIDICILLLIVTLIKYNLNYYNFKLNRS